MTRTLTAQQARETAYVTGSRERQDYARAEDDLGPWDDGAAWEHTRQGEWGDILVVLDEDRARAAWLEGVRDAEYAMADALAAARP